jgi:dolichyl-phosphate beta-glucosyltransferase
MVKATVIVPFYNEERRAPPFLDLLVREARKHPDWLVLLVDDGSRDRTGEMLHAYARKARNLRVLSYARNRGKAYAVSYGVRHARGPWTAFIDADGAISPDQLPLLLGKLREYDIAVGDRSHRESVIDQSRLRFLLGTGFNAYVRLLFDTGVWDHLCGFKAFRTPVAKRLFRQMKSSGWIFDVELFARARKAGYRVCRVPIRWRHIPGSKIRAWSPFLMALQLVKLRKVLHEEWRKG